MEAFIDHLKAVGLYDRVVAFQVGAGSSGEWIKDMSCMLPETMDYSAPMRRHFRSWLRKRYKKNQSAFQMAWSDPSATFDSADISSRKEQSSTTTGHSLKIRTDYMTDLTGLHFCQGDSAWGPTNPIGPLFHRRICSA